MSYTKHLGDADRTLYGRQGPPDLYGKPIDPKLGAVTCDEDGCYDDLRGDSEVAVRLPWWMWLASAGGAYLWWKKRKRG